jgi:low affinity Fe/Cu permease
MFLMYVIAMPTITGDRGVARDPLQRPAMAATDRAPAPLPSRFIDAGTEALGHPLAVAVALGVVVAWLGFGPLVGFSDTYQLIINTATSVVTFIMVFAIQHTTNRETRAINLKLDELLEVVQGANRKLVGVEDMSEATIKELQREEKRRATP